MNQKGIWIRKSPEYGICYETSLKEWEEGVVDFIEFEHPYEPRYLGSLAFLELEKLQQPIHCVKTNRGLLQNHFYPLGNPELRPLLVGKGLAKRVELVVAKDLLNLFSLDTSIIIGASSNPHLEYCQRVGFIPFEPMTLREYFEKLNKSHKPNLH